MSALRSLQLAAPRGASRASDTATDAANASGEPARRATWVAIVSTSAVAPSHRPSAEGLQRTLTP